MKVATWNVNSIRTRLDRLLAFLDREQPDIVCLQELKTTAENFPTEAIEAAGYRCAVHGQRTYNGVAILSREKPVEISRGFGDTAWDDQARLVGATVDDIRIYSAYFPNGGEIGSEKWAFKLGWIERLRQFLQENHRPKERLLICGDTNVALNESDVANPDKWADSVLFAEPARDAIRGLLDWGLVDVFGRLNPRGGVFSWWDYRQLAFPKGDGLRIDHVLATEPLASIASEARIDREERKGKQPSDHAPVLAVFG
jgi:exodeoxyribonuclease-3